MYTIHYFVPRLAMRATLAVLTMFAAFALVACSHPSGSPALAVTEPCAGRVCRVTLTNHSNTDLVVRYADSTGRRELIGLVQPAQSKTFDVQWVHSAGIRVFADSKRYGLYAADLTLERTRAVMEMHYPDDFQPVSDTLMPTKRP